MEAQVAIGQTRLAILFKTYSPNCIGLIIVQATLTMGNSIITVVAGLGFLGMGADTGVPGGAMLSDARSYLQAIKYLCLSGAKQLQLLYLDLTTGDGLRDVLDVKTRIARLDIWTNKDIILVNHLRTSFYFGKKKEKRLMISALK